MSEPASLSRILAGATPSDLADWLERVTADAIAKGRTNIIQFPSRATMTHKQNTTTEASLADIVLENIKAREAEAVAQQAGQLLDFPQPAKPKESSDDDDADTSTAA